MLPPYRPFKDKPVRQASCWTKLKARPKAQALTGTGPKAKSGAGVTEPLAQVSMSSAIGKALSPKRLIVAPAPGTGPQALRSVKSRAITGE